MLCFNSSLVFYIINLLYISNIHNGVKVGIEPICRLSTCLLWNPKYHIALTKALTERCCVTWDFTPFQFFAFYSFKISEKNRFFFSIFPLVFVSSFPKDRKIHWKNLCALVRSAIFISFRKENNFSFLSAI